MKEYYKLGREIIKKLNRNGYEAYFVGGFVRDHLLEMEPNDIDITTNALPKEVQKLFDRTRATGIKYGTISVFLDDHIFEVTTFRSDMNYQNHRKPEFVEYSKNIEDDLKRRDFTINALAMNYEAEIIDLFNGKVDIEKKLIKAIGNPDTRFNEDALRILRAFRFVSKLGFDIEEKTFESIKNNIMLLTKISNERILMELNKIFSYPHCVKALKVLDKADISKAFPEFEKALSILSEKEEYSVNILEFFGLALYTSKIDIPLYWRFSNKDKAVINKIVELVSVTQEDKYNEMIIYRLGKDICLLANSVSKLINSKNDQEDLINDIYHNLPIYKTCDLKFKGQDILRLTTEKNAEVIGDIIDDLTYQVITRKVKNEYNELKKYTMNLMEKEYGKK